MDDTQNDEEGDEENDSQNTSNNSNDDEEDATQEEDDDDEDKDNEDDKEDDGDSSDDSKDEDEDDEESDKDKPSKTTKVDPRLPPGGIEMVTPAVVAGEQYYKIGDYVTFAWNYTSLSVTPDNVNVYASCSVNDETYTIAANQSVEPTGAVTWDTDDYQESATVPLLTEKYTLIVVDAALDVSATPRAGYLGKSDQYVFGMYEPQKYTPLNREWSWLPSST